MGIIGDRFVHGREANRFIRFAGVLLLLISNLSSPAFQSAVPTGRGEEGVRDLSPAVVVRHAPNLNGGGVIIGSVHQLLTEDVTVHGNFTLAGDLFVPGSPTLRVNGQPDFAGIIPGTGSATPDNFRVTLNGNCFLHNLRTRTTPASLPTVPAPPQPTGSRRVIIRSRDESFGDAATLRDLTLANNIGAIAVPPGAYDNFKAASGSAFIFGVQGATQPSL